MSWFRKVNIVLVGRKLIEILNSVIIVLTGIATIITVMLVAYDIYAPIIGLRKYDFTYIQDIANEIVFLLVYVEILRSAVVARRRPEMYVVALGEVGFIVTVRDVLRASILGSTHDLIMSAMSSLIFVGVLFLMYKYILPTRIPVVE